MSSAVAEVAAKTEAFRAILHLPPRPSVIVSDTMGAAQRMPISLLTDASTRTRHANSNGELRDRLRDHFDTDLHKRWPILYRCLSRGEATVLALLRTRSAFTIKWLVDRCLMESSNCLTCGEDKAIPHRLFFCAHHQQARVYHEFDSFDGNRSRRAGSGCAASSSHQERGANAAKDR